MKQLFTNTSIKESFSKLFNTNDISVRYKGYITRYDIIVTINKGRLRKLAKFEIDCISHYKPANSTIIINRKIGFITIWSQEVY